jgi:hypothetical protein
VAVTLAISLLTPAFVGCMADVQDGPVPRAVLVEGTPHDKSCDNPATACTSTCASTSAGTTCNKDCDTPCGLDSDGVKHCTCEDGTFTSCLCAPSAICPQPPAFWYKCWTGSTTAPSCRAYGSATGSTGDFNGKDCSALIGTQTMPPYAECVGTDANTGTEKGCACIPAKDGLLTEPTWVCGSTNHWFVQE